jgi:glyoxylase-like metal-dependent hydrolase (beta-lactamase superfamily II)
LDIVSGGTFRIDGGVMFGVVPKSLWQGVVKPDDQNRVLCATSCILARDGHQTVLVDTGYGGKFGPLDRKFYALEPGEPLLENLEARQVPAESIDTVVLSHLHFDHVGGATRTDNTRRLVPTFPRARHLIGRLEWEDALSRAPELDMAYRPDELLALQESRSMELYEDGAEVVPGLRARLTGGHTRGHMALLFESRGEAALLIGDICPSTAHVRRMWCLAYDLFPLQTRQIKPQLLGEAADAGWWVFWAHDPQVAASRVERDAKREFVLCDSQLRV